MRLVRLAVAGLVGVAVLAGCSDDGQVSETLPSTTRTSASPSATLPPLGPADFPVPAEARQQTPEGVTAFAKYYIDLANHLLLSLDSHPLRDLSRGCATCEQLARGYDADRAAGLRYDGGAITVNSTGTAVADQGKGEVSLFLTQHAATVYGADGNPVPDKSSQDYDLSGGLSVAWDEARSGWVVTELTADRL